MTRKEHKKMVRDFAKNKGLKYKKDYNMKDRDFYTSYKSSISVNISGVQFFFFDEFFGNGFCAEGGQISGYSFDSLFRTMKGYMDGMISKQILIAMCE